MEELHPTEALDREILEDARKKALKILKNADDSISSSKVSWDKKLERAEEKARVGYAEKEQQLRREIMARLPMDKRRIRSDTIERFLNNAMEHFLGSLDRPSLLHILKKELEKKKAEIASVLSGSSDQVKLSGDASIRFRNLSKEECSALIGSSFNGIFFQYFEDPLYMVAGSFPALVVDFPRLRITVSVDRAAETLLLDKRAELAEALLGEGNTEDLTMPPSAASGTVVRSLLGMSDGGGNG